MSKPWLALAGTVVLASTACAGPPVSADRPGLAGTSWTLETLPGSTVPATAAATVQFEGERLAGSDGCNRYSGAYRAVGGRFELTGPLAGTQMACEPERMDLARAFHAALGAARGYRVVDGKLELSGDDGRLLMRLAPQSQALAGTSWRVTGYNNGQQAVVSVAADTQVTLAFADGRIAGTAGCNRYTAGYTADGAALRVSPAAATRMACPQPGVMEQERRFLDALATVATSRIEGDRLELRTASGALAISAVRGD